MKKSIALMLAVLMTLSLAACGGGGGSSDKGGALPGIDMKSTDIQAVTSDILHLSGWLELLHRR